MRIGPAGRSRIGARILLDAYGIEDFWFHDARRTIATFFDEMGRGEIGSAILAHRMKLRVSDKESRERDVMAHVTSKHYSTAQRLNLKAEGDVDRGGQARARLRARRLERAAPAADLLDGAPEDRGAVEAGFAQPVFSKRMGLGLQNLREAFNLGPEPGILLAGG